MILRTSFIALAVFSTSALAQSVSMQALDQTLTQKEGMTRAGDGFYYQKTDSGESFVATSAAGKRAILDKMQDTRAALAARLAKHPSDSGQASLAILDQEIARLDKPQPKNQEVTWHCDDSATIYARALSSGGTSASAYAVDQGGGFSPAISTTNYASAASDNHSNSQTTSTFTPATATITDTRSCVAYSSASVTCANDPTPPTISAFATSTRSGGCP